MGNETHSGARTAGITVLATIATVCALYFGREFFIPIAFAILLNALLGPIVRGLKKIYVPTPIGATLVVLALVGLFVGGAWFLAGRVQDWMTQAPAQFAAAQKKLDALRGPVQKATEVANQITSVNPGPTTSPAPGPAPAAVGPSVFAAVVGTTTQILSGVVEVLLLLLLLLAAGDSFRHKIVKALPLPHDKRAAGEVVQEAERAVYQYLVVNFFINGGQGVLVALALWALGIPNPILWGVFTLVLEFVPFLGATVMMGLLLITASATNQGIGHILLAPGSYLVIGTLQNNVVSPYVFGRRLKLNPVAVLIAVLFWYFVWGVCGAFLAVPILATVKIIADHVESLAVVGEFIGE